LTASLAGARPTWLGSKPSEAAATRAFLALVLSAALAARLWNVATNTYIMFPDETFQYLEPAHRLVFGSGVVTWEYIDGIRSWLLPGVVAGVMWTVSRVSSSTADYLAALRLLCVVASLSVPYVGFRMTARRFGSAPALFVGLLCALSYEAIYAAPVVMTEPLATDATLLAIWLGDDPDRPSLTRLLAAGLLFGLAASLRYQYAPVLAVAVLVQHWRSPRGLAIVASGGVAVVITVLGGLDALTWGLPFQSVWLNFFRNAMLGVTGAMGVQPWFLYGAYTLISMGVAAPVLLAFAVMGASRAPVLGAVVLCTVGLHSLSPHKELRYVFLANACMPMLIGMGVAALVRRQGWLVPTVAAAPVAAALAIAIAGTTTLTTIRHATPPDAWHRGRSMLQATAAVRDIPKACGLGIRTIWVYQSGGHTYWHRDLPIYFETWDAAQKLEATAFRLRLVNVLDGRNLPAYPDAALTANSGKFDVMIGTPADGLPGFTRRACFGPGSADDPTFCVFTRPGGCT
jgi:phosphatidylinositol glycan class B